MQRIYCNFIYFLFFIGSENLVVFVCRVVIFYAASLPLLLPSRKRSRLYRLQHLSTFSKFIYLFICCCVYHLIRSSNGWVPAAVRWWAGPCKYRMGSRWRGRRAEGVVYIYWHPPVANDWKQRNIFQAAGETLEPHYGRQHPALHLWKHYCFLFCFCLLFFHVTPQSGLVGVWGFSFYFLTTFNLRQIMEVLMLLLEKRKETPASYLLGLMLLICLFILSSRLYVISPGSPIEQC